jgi:uncharacterized RDD family membrane protein YckC
MVPFEVAHQGCSLGKQWMGQRMTPDYGKPIDWSASLLRNLLRFAYLLPFGYSSARSVVYNTPSSASYPRLSEFRLPQRRPVTSCG